MELNQTKKDIRDVYAKIAQSNGCGCSCSTSSCCSTTSQDISRSIGYSDEEMNAVPDANLGLGCGSPIALSTIKEGDVVLDLGSGAGFDAFLAAKKVGKTGKVIGIDMTEEMITKAEENAKKYNYQNTEFRLGDIEELPVENDSVDVIISNCVINLAVNKDKVFSESFRVLKKGGKMFVSDIVLLKELSSEQRNDKDLIAGCVGGALLKEEYLDKIKKAGFKVNIQGEDSDISKKQYRELPVESLKLEIFK